jgi:hypothetical protein
MGEKTERYAISALRNKHAAMAGEIIRLERKLRHLRESIQHVDATLKLLDPVIDPTIIPAARPRRRIKLFRQGELGRMITDALRRAGGGPLPTDDIVSLVMQRAGMKKEAWATMKPRIRGNLSYLVKIGRVEKIGANRTARWRLNS